MRVVIVGGGVGGLAAAIGLRKAGIDVEVHEKYDHPARRASALTLWSSAIAALRELGVEDPDRFGAPIEAAEVREQDGALVAEIPVGAISRKLGAPSYEIDRRLFRETCLELLGKSVVRLGSECVGVEHGEGTAVAVLADGRRARGDLVIGADGAHSVTRAAVAGRPRLRYAGYSAWAGVLERFDHPLLAANHHVEIWAGDSIGGVADLGGGRVRWYATHESEPDENWGNIDTNVVLDHVRSWFELLPAAVEASCPDSVVTMQAWELEPLPTWVAGRLVLLGDAAHLTSPSVSGGACATIEDAAALVRRLLAPVPTDQALRDFELERKRRDERIVRESRWAGRLQHLHSPVGRWARDRAIEHLPARVLSRVTARMASGA